MRPTSAFAGAASLTAATLPPDRRATARQAFGRVFNTTADDLDMHLVYDVSHNIAKVRPPRAFAVACLSCCTLRADALCPVPMRLWRQVEEHMVGGRPRKLLVHRKGATRAFPPHHPLIPVDYQVSPSLCRTGTAPRAA